MVPNESRRLSRSETCSVTMILLALRWPGDIKLERAADTHPNHPSIILGEELQEIETSSFVDLLHQSSFYPGNSNQASAAELSIE